MRVTKQQFFKHYLDAGMPKVYAAMAAEEETDNGLIFYSASDTLMIGSFVWGESAMGHAFWLAIYDELRHAGK